MNFISGKRNRYLFVRKAFLVFIICCFFINNLFGASISPAKAKEKRTNLISLAKDLLGTPYRYGATGPKSFDCSGFVSYVVKKTLNIKLPRRSGDILQACEEISKDELEAGDLVFFKAGQNTGITHVGIYLGDDEFISALSDGPRTGVEISSLSGGYWGRKFYAVGRLIPSVKIPEVKKNEKIEDNVDNVNEEDIENVEDVVGQEDLNLENNDINKVFDEVDSDSKKIVEQNDFCELDELENLDDLEKKLDSFVEDLTDKIEEDVNKIVNKEDDVDFIKLGSDEENI